MNIKNNNIQQRILIVILSILTITLSLLMLIKTIYDINYNSIGEITCYNLYDSDIANKINRKDFKCLIFNNDKKLIDNLSYTNLLTYRQNLHFHNKEYKAELLEYFESFDYKEKNELFLKYQQEYKTSIFINTLNNNLEFLGILDCVKNCKVYFSFSGIDKYKKYQLFNKEKQGGRTMVSCDLKNNKINNTNFKLQEFNLIYGIKYCNIVEVDSGYDILTNNENKKYIETDITNIINKAIYISKNYSKIIYEYY